MKSTQAMLFSERPPRPVTPHARATGKGRKSAPAPRPWKCSILAVDTAANSGWAHWATGSLVSSGEIDTREEDAMRMLVRDLCGVDGFHGLPPILVLEAPYGGHKHPGEVATLVALGMARERWERAWKDAGEARSRIVRVQPQTWRSAVLGGWAVGKPRAELRASELSMARGMARREDVGDDEAAAICIGRWASYAPEVGAVIGKRAREASMQAWGVRP